MIQGRGWLAVFLLQILGAASVESQVRGVVWDSVTVRPLAGATVQIIGEDPHALSRSTHTDSLGRFAFDVIPAGRYSIGFLHPALDSLGIELQVRALEIGSQPTDVQLAIPSPRRIRTSICGARPGAGSGAVLGTVRDALDGSPIAHVVVRGEWLEYTIGAQRVSRSRPTVTDTTRANGWFALCGVPGQGLLLIGTARSTDSTDLVEVEVPASGLARRDLYAANNSQRIRMSGEVLAAANRQRLRDVEVSVAGGGRTRTDANGAWTLGDVPAGTHMLDVRAIGYYPVHRPVDVLPAAGPLRVELLTMRAMLDTIRVTASRVASNNMRDFENRRRTTGSGRFLTRDDIERLKPTQSSDVLRSVAGVSVLGSGSTRTIYMKGGFDDNDFGCQPDVYVDGVFILPDSLNHIALNAEVLDVLARPDDIGAMEVYREPFVPPQFSRGLRGCGAIVLWRLPPLAVESRASWKGRLFKATALVAGGLVVGALVGHAVK